ncbi:MAG: hypothetical protein MR911_10545 [Spirochaetia bacterium]|nr:hypothetical protein [Spirochaetia bacterium]
MEWENIKKTGKVSNALSNNYSQGEINNAIESVKNFQTEIEATTQKIKSF